jgi:hypothetical protein
MMAICKPKTLRKINNEPVPLKGIKQHKMREEQEKGVKNYNPDFF